MIFTLNVNNKRITIPNIHLLDKMDVYVYWSNKKGMHTFGTSLIAKNNFDAQPGNTSGMSGRSYGILYRNEELHILSFDEIQNNVHNFIEYAVTRPELKFHVQSPLVETEEINDIILSKLFKNAIFVQNISLPLTTWTNITKQLIK